MQTSKWHQDMTDMNVRKVSNTKFAWIATDNEQEKINSFELTQYPCFIGMYLVWWDYSYTVRYRSMVFQLLPEQFLLTPVNNMPIVLQHERVLSLSGLPDQALCFRKKEDFWSLTPHRQHHLVTVYLKGSLGHVMDEIFKKK